MALVIALYARAYHRWASGWLSHHIDKALREMRRSKSPSWSQFLKTMPSRNIVSHRISHYCYAATRIGVRYVTSDFRRNAFQLYLPTYTSVVLLGAVLVAVLLWPHWPHHLDMLWRPFGWPDELRSDLDDKQAEGVSRLFEGLIVVIIALIVFVAESIRSSRSADEKRVLLKISKLWVLVVLATLSPIVFLILPLTELSAALALTMAAITIWGFAQVVRNLLDPDTSVKAQRNFLKERVRNIVLVSVRQRVGNKILFDTLKKDATSGMEIAISQSFLPQAKKNYVFIRAPQGGIIDDINVAALERLGRFLTGQEERSKEVADATVASDQTSGQSITSPKAGAGNAAVPRSFLLRRFREEISDESIFSNDAGLIAIPKSIANRKGVIEEVNGLVGTMFKFSNEEPPSTAFRREMRSTKDRLLGAVLAGTLGEVEELRDSYRLVAEEFLTVLNSLGGGYSAEQARKERNDWFGSWDEVRWLTGDVRDILKAAADTKNGDVVKLVLMLPFSIATRAFQAGDNLLFQEFLGFAAYIYHLGVDQDPSAETRSILIDRAHRYVHDMLNYLIEPSLTEDGDDE